MELLVYTAIVPVSVGVGLASARLMLWGLLFLMMRHVAAGDTAAAPADERAYEQQLRFATRSA